MENWTSFCDFFSLFSQSKTIPAKLFGVVVCSGLQREIFHSAAVFGELRFHERVCPCKLRPNVNFM